MDNKTISVTSPLLPPLEKFIPYLGKIWESCSSANGSDMHHALGEALCEYLGVKHIVLFTNATLALIIALQASRVTGEVITALYSLVVTNHTLLWNELKPIFVDINQDFMNPDPSWVGVAIAPQTTAILPVHCYGNPCGVEAIQQIVDIHHLKVTYDVAHTFITRNAGDSVLRHGDLSILSFHAIKMFNTFGGGTIICSNRGIRQHLNHLKDFDFTGRVTVITPGISGRLNEVGVALGLLQLEHVDQALERRRGTAERYQRPLAGVPGIRRLRPGTQTFVNNACSPILVEDDLPLSYDELYQRLRDRNVLMRHYFCPLIGDLPMCHSLPSAALANLPMTQSISSRVLCPLICPRLAATDVELVTGLIVSAAMPWR